MENFNKNINNYYEEKKNYIKSKININKNYNFLLKNNIVDIFENTNLVLKAEYHIIGVYNIPLSFWVWAWDISFINKSLIQPIKNIKNILPNSKINPNSKLYDEIYFLISNGSFYISAENLPKLIKLALYYTQGIWYFPIKYQDESDKLEYIIIDKILQIG